MKKKKKNRGAEGGKTCHVSRSTLNLVSGHGGLSFEPLLDERRC